MLKETEKNRLFGHIFVIGNIKIKAGGGGGGGDSSTSGYAYDQGDQAASIEIQ